MKISPFLLGQDIKLPPFCWVKIQISPLFVGTKSKIHPFLSGQNSKFTPFYRVKIRNLPLFIASTFCKCSSQTFLSFRTLHLAHPKLVGTPCIRKIWLCLHVCKAYVNISYVILDSYTWYSSPVMPPTAKFFFWLWMDIILEDRALRASRPVSGRLLCTDGGRSTRSLSISFRIRLVSSVVNTKLPSRSYRAKNISISRSEKLHLQKKPT